MKARLYSLFTPQEGESTLVTILVILAIVVLVLVLLGKR